jgi:hypothetical protein
LWRPLKNSKAGSGSYSDEAYPYMSKNGNKISVDCPFKGLSNGIDTGQICDNCTRKRNPDSREKIQFLFYLNIFLAL